MSLQPVAVLGLDGWVNTPKEKMDNLFMHFVESNKSQSVTAKDSTFSFQYILNNGRASEVKLRDELTYALTTYFGGYYSDVTASVNVVEDPKLGGASILEIFLEVKDEYGKSYNLAKVSSDINSKTIRWININNYGDANKFSQ